MNDRSRPQAAPETLARKSDTSLRPANDVSIVDILREFDTGYALGYGAGVDVGYGAAQHEQTHTWLAEIEWSPKLAATRGPSLSELRKVRSTLPEHRHGQPCGCPRCGWVRRHGGDHAGGPVVWFEPERVAS